MAYIPREYRKQIVIKAALALGGLGFCFDYLFKRGFVRYTHYKILKELRDEPTRIN